MKLKKIISHVTGKMSPRLYFTLAYLHNRNKLPNLNNPKDLSEILIKRVLDGEINKLYYLADKYLVRDEVMKKGYGELLTPLIGVYDNPEDIPFDRLPDKFAIKLNYGAGMNIICTDKTKFDIEEAKNKLTNWLSSTKTFSYAETHYNLINRKIVIEEFIDDGNGGFPIDYKFMCVNGTVTCILACTGREDGHTFYTPFDLDWNRIKGYDKRTHDREVNIPKPDNLEDMIKVAIQLSKGFPFVRVDLYSNGNRIWFGEYTLTPAGCILHGWTQEALNDIGEKYRQVNCHK